MQFYASSSSALASEDSTAMFGVFLREAYLSRTKSMTDTWATSCSFNSTADLKELQYL